MEEGEQSCLQAKVKTQIIRQIFKDLSPKNLKNVEKFYLICSEEQMELQFVSGSKDILIAIILKRDLFSSYSYSKSKATLHKYTLSDFSPIPIMFQNNKHILDLCIDLNHFQLTYMGGLGKTKFQALAVDCDEDDEQMVIGEKDLKPQQREASLMELKFSKVAVFQCIIRYAKAVKIKTLWMRYDSVRHRLEVTDRKENQQIKWLLRVQEVGRNTLNSQQEFDFGSFNCAMNLLPNDSPLKLTFFPQFMLMEVLERERTFFTIKIMGKIDH